MAVYPLWEVLGPFKMLYSSYLESVCKEYELTRTELDILLFLANNPTCDSAVDIVQKRYLAKSHVSTSIRTLTERGFLEQFRDHRDKRVIRLKICNAAAAVIQAGIQAQKACYECMCEGIPENRIAEMNDVLLQIRENIKKYSETVYW